MQTKIGKELEQKVKRNEKITKEEMEEFFQAKKRSNFLSEGVSAIIQTNIDDDLYKEIENEVKKWEEQNYKDNLNEILFIKEDGRLNFDEIFQISQKLMNEKVDIENYCYFENIEEEKLSKIRKFYLYYSKLLLNFVSVKNFQFFKRYFQDEKNCKSTNDKYTFILLSKYNFDLEECFRYFYIDNNNDFNCQIDVKNLNKNNDNNNNNELKDKEKKEIKKIDENVLIGVMTYLTSLIERILVDFIFFQTKKEKNNINNIQKVKMLKDILVHPIILKFFPPSLVRF